MTTYCRTSLNYLDGLEPVPTPVEILDGRATGPHAWETCGFQLIRHASKLESLLDVSLDSPHYEEIGELARSLTGCDVVLYFPALIRSPETAAISEDLNPIQFVHSDYTTRYREMLETEGHPYVALLKPFMERTQTSQADIRRARRILTLQLWRNLGPETMKAPIAFCDARTVSRSSLTPVPVDNYGGYETGFESYAVAPPETPEDHTWVTFPAMTRDELVVFRAYDSERADRGEPFWTPHSAFIDPTVPADAPERVSLEMRAICLFLD